MIPGKVMMFASKEMGKKCIEVLKLNQAGPGVFDGGEVLRPFYWKEFNKNWVVEPMVLLTKLNGFNKVNPMIIDEADLVVIAFNMSKEKHCRIIAEIMKTHIKTNILLVSNTPNPKQTYKVPIIHFECLRKKLKSQLKVLPKLYNYNNFKGKYFETFRNYYRPAAKNLSSLKAFVKQEITIIQSISESFSNEMSLLFESLSSYTEKCMSKLTRFYSDLLYISTTLDIAEVVDEFTLKRFEFSYQLSEIVNFKIKPLRTFIEKLSHEPVLTMCNRPDAYFTNRKTGTMAKFSPLNEFLDFNAIRIENAEVFNATKNVSTGSSLILYGTSNFSLDTFEILLPTQTLQFLQLKFSGKYAASVSINQEIYVFGGCFDGKAIKNFRISSGNPKNIHEISDCPVVLDEFFASTIGTDVVVAGNIKSTLNGKLYWYNIENDAFKEDILYRFEGKKSRIIVVEKGYGNYVALCEEVCMANEEMWNIDRAKGKLVCSTSNHSFIYFVTEGQCKRYLYRLNHHKVKLEVIQKFLV